MNALAHAISGKRFAGKLEHDALVLHGCVEGREFGLGLGFGGGSSGFSAAISAEGIVGGVDCIIDETGVTGTVGSGVTIGAGITISGALAGEAGSDAGVGSGVFSFFGAGRTRCQSLLTIDAMSRNDCRT